MKLREGVQVYVAGKRVGGAVYAKGIQTLSAFSRHAGNVELSRITERKVSSFLDGPHTSAITWHGKYNLFRNFFLFWVARNAISAVPMPPQRPSVVTTFVPYIYSRTEIRLLLSTVRSSQEKSACKIDARTLRTFLLFLYGTGASVGEARGLLREDLDFKRRTITLRSNRFDRSREIPIGPDLYRVLRRYHTTNHRNCEMNAPQFFLTKQGNPLKESAACQTFQRLRRMAGIARDDGARYQPRPHDLRHTFAVHRVTAWIKRGADLNRMIPALSAYIGQVGLGSTYRYLNLTPERFRAQLDRLSPRPSKRHWRDNPALMRFLTETLNMSRSATSTASD
jgi:integrase/recombinase XerD